MRAQTPCQRGTGCTAQWACLRVARGKASAVGVEAEGRGGLGNNRCAPPRAPPLAPPAPPRAPAAGDRAAAVAEAAAAAAFTRDPAARPAALPAADAAEGAGGSAAAAGAAAAEEGLCWIPRDGMPADATASTGISRSLGTALRMAKGAAPPPCRPPLPEGNRMAATRADWKEAVAHCPAPPENAPGGGAAAFTRAPRG